MMKSFTGFYQLTILTYRLTRRLIVFFCKGDLPWSPEAGTAWKPSLTWKLKIRVYNPKLCGLTGEPS